MQPFTSGAFYLNNLCDENEERVRAAYGENLDRLVTLKNKYDPTNLFRLTANVRPTAGKQRPNEFPDTALPLDSMSESRSPS